MMYDLRKLPVQTMDFSDRYTSPPLLLDAMAAPSTATGEWVDHSARLVRVDGDVGGRRLAKIHQTTEHCIICAPKYFRKLYYKAEKKKKSRCGSIGNI